MHIILGEAIDVASMLAHYWEPKAEAKGVRIPGFVGVATNGTITLDVANGFGISSGSSGWIPRTTTQERPCSMPSASTSRWRSSCKCMATAPLRSGFAETSSSRRVLGSSLWYRVGPSSSVASLPLRTSAWVLRAAGADLIRGRFCAGVCGGELLAVQKLLGLSADTKESSTMAVRFRFVAGACGLVLTSFACSRQAAEPRPPSETQSLTPAAGSVAPDANAASRPRCRENFAAFDDDGDGRVSEGEFGAKPHAHPDPLAVFRDRDRDRDGSLVESEFCAGWRGAAGAGRAAGPGAGAGPGQGMGPGPGGRRPNGPMAGARCEQHFDSFDANHDQKLTQDEFAAWPHARGDAETLFGERDLDRDGTIIRTEFCSGWSSPPAR